MNKFSEIKKESPIIIDTCIFMVGIEKRQTNPEYSLDNMKKNWMNDVLSYFENIKLHEVVYKELDSDTKKIIDEHIGKNIEIVSDKDLFDKDPEYMRIFNEIHDHPLMYASFSKTKNQGEVRSLAYASYYGIPYFSSKDSDACDVCNEIEDLKDNLAVEFPLPPIERQRKLSNLFVSLQKKQKELSAVYEKQTEYAKLLRQNILQEAIEGKLTADWRNQNPVQKGNPNYDAESLFEDIQKENNSEKKQKELSPIMDKEKPFETPEGWKWVRLGEISDIVRGGSPRPAGDKTYYDGNIPFLKVADITSSDEKELCTYTYTIREAGLKKTRFVEKETLMLTNSGATLGIPTICMIETTFNDGIAVFLDIKNQITKDYLFYFLKSKTQWFLKEAAKGQGQPNLNTDIISSTVLALPPLAEQKEIVIRIEKYLRYISDLESQIAKRELLTKQLMQSILRNAFEEM